MRKTLLAVGILLALIALAGLLVPILFKDRIIAAALAEVNRRVDATVRFDRGDLTFVSSFPDLRLALDGVSVTRTDGVELARIGGLRATLDLASVAGGDRVRVRSLEVRDARFHVIASTEPAKASEPSTFALDLDALTLQNVSAIYEDGDLRVAIDDLDASGALTASADRSRITTRATLAALSVRSGDTDLLRNVAVDASLDLDRDGDGVLTLGENRLALNALAVTFQGTVTPKGENLALDLSFAARETSFASILSLVPAVYSADFASLVSEGSLALQGTTRGILGGADSLPGFDVSLQVNDGRFHYPSLPTSVDDVNLDVRLHHPEGGTDLTEIDVRAFQLAVGGSPIEGSVRIRHPVSDPDIEARMVGRIDLGALRSALPAQGATWDGRLSVDLDVAGRVSQFTAEDVESVRAKGTFELEGLTWNTTRIERLAMRVDPRHADLTDIRLRFGESDLHGTGVIDNFVAYAMTDATLVGRMDLASSFLDLDAHAGGDSEEAEKSGGSSGVVVVPTNLDLALDVRADRVRYGGHDATNARSSLAVKDGVVRIDELSFEMLGGALGLSGTYAAPTAAHADLDMRVEMVSFDVGKTVDAFETLQKLVPIAGGARGRFGTNFTVKTRLNQDLSPDLATLLSTGRVKTAGLVLAPAFLGDLSERLGNKRLSTLDLSDADIGFDLKNGRMEMARTSIRVGGVASSLGGSAGVLDRRLDLDLGMKVPVGDIKGADFLGKLAPAGLVDVVAKIGGTWDRPTISLDVGDAADAAGAVVGEVVNAALAEARRRGESLTAEAERQADKLRTEAGKQADALRAEAKKQGDRLVKEAKGNALKELAAREARKKLIEEADKASKKLEKEADKQATAAVGAAKAQRDELLAEAEKRAR